MILTELRGYGIAENGISVNSEKKHHLKELEETIPTIPTTQYCQKWVTFSVTTTISAIKEGVRMYTLIP